PTLATFLPWPARALGIYRSHRDREEAEARAAATAGFLSGLAHTASNASKWRGRRLLKVVFAVDITVQPRARPHLRDDTDSQGVLVFSMGAITWDEFCAGSELFIAR